jgi:hypothetical protein
MIIGPGSAAFEVIRDLVFHLPAMVTPRWVRSRSQPIALADIIEYLVRLPAIPEAAGGIYDVGGPEVLTYEDLMRQFGELVGRRPVILPVPVLTPQLSSYWLNLVTAVPTNVARALIEGSARRARRRRADPRADFAASRDLSPGRRDGARKRAGAGGPSALGRRLDAAPAEPAGLRVLRQALQRYCRRHRTGRTRGASSRRSAARTATTSSTDCGGCAACSTASPAAPA